MRRSTDPSVVEAGWQVEADERVGDADAWDAAIVGAGPAGSICALQLALCGHRVLLVERHRFPRDKACGDLLIPGSLEALRRAGLYERVRRSGRALDAAAVSSPSRIEWPIRGEFVVIKRLDLDAMIARGAAEAGGSVSAVRGARLRCGLEGSRLTVTNGRGAGGRVLAIGEAIGTTYPFTGEGMGKAMESGELAAEAIHRALTEDRPDWLDEYPRRLREELAPHYRGYRVAQDWFSRPLLNDLLAWRARRSPFLQRKASQMVAEASDPREAFSLRGLLRSLWS